MGGTPEGAAKAVETKRKKYGLDHFSKVGKQVKHGKGGFGSSTKGKDGLTGPERAKLLRAKQKDNNGNSEIST